MPQVVLEALEQNLDFRADDIATGLLIPMLTLQAKVNAQYEASRHFTLQRSGFELVPGSPEASLIRVRTQMRDFARRQLLNPDRPYYVWHRSFARRTMDLAEAYCDAKRPGDAIELLKVEMKNERNEFDVLFKKVTAEVKKELDARRRLRQKTRRKQLPESSKDAVVDVSAQYAKHFAMKCNAGITMTLQYLIDHVIRFGGEIIDIVVEHKRWHMLTEIVVFCVSFWATLPGALSDNVHAYTSMTLFCSVLGARVIFNFQSWPTRYLLLGCVQNSVSTRWVNWLRICVSKCRPTRLGCARFC